MFRVCVHVRVVCLLANVFERCGTCLRPVVSCVFKTTLSRKILSHPPGPYSSRCELLGLGGIGSQRPPGVVAPLGCASPPGVLWAPRNPNEYVSIPIFIATYSERAAWCEVCDVIIHVLSPRASSPPPTPPRPPVPAPSLP